MTDVIAAIHQAVPVVHLQRQIAEMSPARLLIATTHYPYPGERESLMQLAPDVTLLTFADLLTDADMVGCDDEARERGLVEVANGRRSRYYTCFMRMSRHLKNKLVLKKLLAILPNARLLHADGLGIDADAWRAAGSLPLPKDVPRPTVRASLGRRLRRILGGEIYLVANTGSTHHALVFGSIQRIPLAAGILVERIRWPLEWGLTPPSWNAAAIASVLRSRGIAPFPPIFTTIHQYHLGMDRVAAACGQSLGIVADGHHPSNYPASYVEIFGDCEIIAANPLSAAWFQRHRRHVIPGAWFQASPTFERCKAAPVCRVMLVLNHAGDWSALIERSDTDRLVLAFVEVARKWPTIEFVIRVHPTMAAPEHEGVGSIERIRAMVAGVGLTNLAVSNCSLPEDLERGDLYLSEYSQVLIDAWQRGKVGVAVNLTGRRSFMADYEALGFHSVGTQDGLGRLLQVIVDDPKWAVAAQNRAVERFNATLEHWNAEGILEIEPRHPVGAPA